MKPTTSSDVPSRCAVAGGWAAAAEHLYAIVEAKQVEAKKAYYAFDYVNGHRLEAEASSLNYAVSILTEQRPNNSGQTAATNAAK